MINYYSNLFLMNTFLYFHYGNRMLYFLFFLIQSKSTNIETGYKYSQYCTPLSQSECSYFLVLAIMDFFFPLFIFSNKFLCFIFLCFLVFVFVFFLISCKHCFFLQDFRKPFVIHGVSKSLIFISTSFFWKYNISRGYYMLPQTHLMEKIYLQFERGSHYLKETKKYYFQ